MTHRREWIYAWLLLSPALVLLFAFTHIPAISTIWDSFFSTPRGIRPSKFVGLGNYEKLLMDETFWQVLSNSIWYAVVTIPVSVALALLMAIWVDGKLSGRSFVFYTPGFGLIDQISGALGYPSVNWLGNPELALGSIMVVSIWKEAGFFMIFYLAALQSIPPVLREAAAIEGASRWTFFRRVTFPLLMPTTLFVSVNAVINSFRMVDHVFVMTEGGPNNASSLLLFYIYETAFKFWDTAYASTLTVVLLVLLSVIALGQFLLLDKRVHYR